jgi:NAD(P)-dependent dehydrogenase (short-subunit alcohol dehydrogenase family)
VRPLKDQAVLITGAGRGIGKRLAIGFAAEGARVGLLARSQAELDLAKLEIEHAGGTALRIRADVRDYEQMSAAVERMRAVFGGVHVLIAAAAIQGPIGPLVELKPRAWAETIETNLMGAMHACRAALPQMIEKRRGKIIVIGGGGAASGRPRFSAYAASKAAVVRFVETLAEEVRDFNVQVNCMAPGGTYTHMTDEILHSGERAGSREIEEAEDVRLTGGTHPDKQINLALFLASERSNHISGKLIHVNDDWKRLERENMNPEAYTLRRLSKV